MKQRLLPFSLCFLALVTSAEAATGGPDAFGYTHIDSRSATGPDYDWINISATGEVISTSKGEAFELAAPFIFYGKAFDSLVVSENGYLSTDLTDNGGDNSGDCPFPDAVSFGGGDRIAVVHDDLEFGTDGKVLYQYFGDSPHSANSCGVHVITWRRMIHLGDDPDTEAFSFQVLLFDNFDILMQFNGGNPETGSNSSTGIQDEAASLGLAGGSGLGYSCNTAGGIPASCAVLFQPPTVTVTTSDDEFDSTTVNPSLGAGLSLREALHAPAGTRIEFSSSMNGLTTTLIPGDDLCVLSAQAIDASNLGDGFTLDADGQGRIFQNEVPVVLCGLTIENGLSDTSGTGLQYRNSDASVLINDCRFFNNTATDDRDGGAIAGSGKPRVVINQSEFISNSADRHGGAIASTYIWLRDCTLSLNDAGGSGGGVFIYYGGGEGETGFLSVDGGLIALNDSSGNGGGISVASEGDLEVRGTAFLSNEAADEGGAIYLSGGAGSETNITGSSFTFNDATNGGALRSFATVALSDCTFSGNDALEDGGGVYHSSGNLTVEGSTFSSNESGVLGGGIYMSSADLEVANSTFSENVAPQGAALAGFVLVNCLAEHCTFYGNEGEVIYGSGSTTVEVGHCVFNRNVDNGDFGFSATIFLGSSLGHNLYDGSPASYFDHATDINADADLDSLAFNGGTTRTHALPIDSPAVDAGDAGIVDAPETDQRGADRIIGGRIDIGAVERVPELLVTTLADELTDPGAGLSLREALNAVDPGGSIRFASALSGGLIQLASANGGQGESLLVEKDVTVDASSLSEPIRIGGGDEMPILVIEGSSVTLRSLDLLNGQAAGIGGAGLRVANSSTVTAENVNIRRCRAYAPGAGAWVGGGSLLEMKDCEITSNETIAAGGAPGGGIAVDDGGSLVLKRCSVLGNMAGSSGDGGGIFAGADSLVDVARSTIANNIAKGFGGGIAAMDGASVILENATISTNDSTSSGGGVYSDGANWQVSHSTIANNACEDSSGTAAGGLRFINLSTASFGHTIVDANRNGSGPRAIARSSGSIVDSLGYNLSDGNVTVFDQPSDQINRVAYLTPLVDLGGPVKCHALLSISPAIDAGDPAITDAPTVDARGKIRVADGNRNDHAVIDIGAYEATKPRIVNGLQDVEDANDGVNTLREALEVVINGGRIVFDPALSGGIIDLGTAAQGTGTRLQIAKTCQIDATSLLSGINVSGASETRVFAIPADVSVLMNAVNISAGDAGTGKGGGIRCQGDLVFTHGTLIGNSARFGGAISMESGSLLLQNATLAGNSADEAGGAISAEGDARLRAEHSTVANNSSGGPGAGGFALSSRPLVLYSSIIGGNGNNFSISGGILGDQLSSEGYNLQDNSSAPVINALDSPGDITDSSIAMANFGVYAWAAQSFLPAGSEHLDRGDPTAKLLPVMDIGGYVRIAGGRMDIGARESDAGSLDTDGDMMPDWWELRHGFDVDFSGDAAEDPDADGEDNLAEYRAGTNPLKSDLLPMTPVEILAITVLPDASVVELGVTTDPGFKYDIYGSPDLASWSLIRSFTATAIGNETVTSVDATDFGGITTQYFFRVERD